MSTNKNSNRIEVPEAKQALDQFKMEVLMSWVYR